MLRVRKAPFVLLEVLIALSLVIGVSSFFAGNAPWRLKRYQASLFALEKERLWELELLKIRQNLPTYVDTLPAKFDKKSVREAKLKIQVKGVNKEVLKPYYLWCPSSRQGSDGKKYYKVYLSEKSPEKGRPSVDYTFFITLS
jgi:hypothetical protein